MAFKKLLGYYSPPPGNSASTAEEVNLLDGQTGEGQIPGQKKRQTHIGGSSGGRQVRWGANSAGKGAQLAGGGEGQVVAPLCLESRNGHCERHKIPIRFLASKILNNEVTQLQTQTSNAPEKNPKNLTVPSSLLAALNSG